MNIKDPFVYDKSKIPPSPPPFKYMSQHDDVVEPLLDPSEHLPEDIFENVLVYACDDPKVDIDEARTHPATILCHVSRRYHRFAMGRRCWPVLGDEMFKRLQEIYTPIEFVKKDARALYFNILSSNVFGKKEWTETLYSKGARVTMVSTDTDDMVNVLNAGHPSTLEHITDVKMYHCTDNTLQKCVQKCYGTKSLNIFQYLGTSDILVNALRSLQCLRKLILISVFVGDFNHDELCSAIPHIEDLFLHDVYSSADIWVSLSTLTSLKYLKVIEKAPMTVSSCSRLPPNLITLKIFDVESEMYAKSIEFHKRPTVGYKHYPFSQSELVQYPNDTILGAVGKRCPNIMVIHCKVNITFCRMDSSEYSNVTE